MRILYLDDSGIVHAHDPLPVAVFAGFSVPEHRWHTLIRQINGAKFRYHSRRGVPYQWEIKSVDFLSTNAWQRAKNRNLCFEMVDILSRNGCHVHAISLEKANAKDPLLEDKFVPLMLRRLVTKFNDEVITYDTTGTVVLDWSTHQLDNHIAQCITAMSVTHVMDRLRGGVTYGSSVALPPLQVADLVASTIRRDVEGQPHVADLAAAFRSLRYQRVGAVDDYGNPMASVGKVF